MKVSMFEIDIDYFPKLFMSTKGDSIEVIKGLPEDSKLIFIQYNELRKTIMFYFESSEFKEVEYMPSESNYDILPIMKRHYKGDK